MWTAIKIFFGKAFKWIKVNWKWLLFGLAMVGVTLLALLWRKKNKKIQSLKNEVALLRAKLKLEALAAKNEVLLENLEDLKNKEETVKEEIEAIESELIESIPEDMSTEEIVSRFRDLL